MSSARPDFAVIGAMRAGTTLLYEMLRSVKGVCMPRMKETDFFCSLESVARGPAWFARQFDDPGALWGDISPNYAKTDIHPRAAELLYAANPAMQIFFIARDPIERMISHYKMEFFIDGNIPCPEELLSTRDGMHILHASKYYTCLEPFWEHFGDQVTVLSFDEMIHDPNRTLATICNVLGISAAEHISAIEPRNSFDDVSRTPRWWSALRRSGIGTEIRARIPRPLLNYIKSSLAVAAPTVSPPPFSDAVRAQIAEALAPDIRAFCKHAGMTFPNSIYELRDSQR